MNVDTRKADNAGHRWGGVRGRTWGLLAIASTVVGLGAVPLMASASTPASRCPAGTYQSWSESYDPPVNTIWISNFPVTYVWVDTALGGYLFGDGTPMNNSTIDVLSRVGAPATKAGFCKNSPTTTTTTTIDHERRPRRCRSRPRRCRSRPRRCRSRPRRCRSRPRRCRSRPRRCRSRPRRCRSRPRRCRSRPRRCRSRPRRCRSRPRRCRSRPRRCRSRPRRCRRRPRRSRVRPRPLRRRSFRRPRFRQRCCRQQCSRR